jgi:hypothetical protein
MRNLAITQTHHRSLTELRKWDVAPHGEIT